MFFIRLMMRSNFHHVQNLDLPKKIIKVIFFHFLMFQRRTIKHKLPLVLCVKLLEKILCYKTKDWII